MTTPTLPAGLVDAFARARRILFITGAGISADSGLPTYRGFGGLYDGKPTEEGLPIEEVLSGHMLALRPQLTWKYLLQIEQGCRNAQPNPAHLALAEIERSRPPGAVCVLTQNIDGLHRMAGTQNLIEIHGDLHRLLCTRCGHQQTVADYAALDTLPPPCPECKQGWLRPEVVFFGEMLPEDALSRLQAAMTHPELDLVVSIGTTSVFPYIVQPVVHAVRNGIASVEINPGETTISAHVQFAIKERAAPTLQAILDAMSGSRPV